MHKTTERKERKMVIQIGYLDVAIGHQSRTGHHVHDNRPRRQRTRKAALAAAMRD